MQIFWYSEGCWSPIFLKKVTAVEIVLLMWVLMHNLRTSIWIHRSTQSGPIFKDPGKILHTLHKTSFFQPDKDKIISVNEKFKSPCVPGVSQEGHNCGHHVLCLLDDAYFFLVLSYGHCLRQCPGNSQVLFIVQTNEVPPWEGARCMLCVCMSTCV